MTPSFSSLLLALAACAYAAYEIWNGYKYFKLSGFSFFLIGGIWIGTPFLGIAAILILPSARSLLYWEVGLLAVWFAAFPWRGWQSGKARRQYPEKWARWIRKLDQSRKRNAK
jgi:hypothetical protein